MKRLLLTALGLLILTPSAAAEPPYAPRKLDASQLLNPSTYQHAPIRLDQWTLVGTDTVAHHSRLDFELRYDVDYWEMIEFFEDAWKHRKPVTVLDPDVFPNAKNPELIVFGTMVNGDKSRFTLGHPDLPYRFTIDVRPDDNAKAVVVVHNAIYSIIYSGVMPARTPFRPSGAKEVPFRWN